MLVKAHPYTSVGRQTASARDTPVPPNNSTLARDGKLPLGRSETLQPNPSSAARSRPTKNSTRSQIWPISCRVLSDGGTVNVAPGPDEMSRVARSSYPQRKIHYCSYNLLIPLLNFTSRLLPCTNPLLASGSNSSSPDPLSILVEFPAIPPLELGALYLRVNYPPVPQCFPDAELTIPPEF